MTILNSFVSLDAVINAVRSGDIGNFDVNTNEWKKDGTDFNVYWKNIEGSPTLKDIVYVGEPEDVTEDVPDEEYDYALMPEPVKEKGWWVTYYGYMIMDATSSALKEKPDATNEEILSAIKYYSHYDNFYDFYNENNNLPIPE